MEMRKWPAVWGAFMRPPSVAMKVNGSRVDSCRSKERDTAAFRKRKRYLRRSTFMFGQGRPLTRMTSPYIPDSLELSKISGAELAPPSANITSLRMMGTSYPEPEPSPAPLADQ